MRPSNSLDFLTPVIIRSDGYKGERPISNARLPRSREKAPDISTDIVAFAELGGYIDEPVRTYSTGICMRLGFAVAIHTDPQILLIDEVFSVGDGIFIDKCVEWMDAFQKAGGTIVIASHDLDLVRQRCHHALWLDGGQVRALGDAHDVADAYGEWIARSHAPPR